MERQIAFTHIDKILKNNPRDINQLIYDYYKTDCDKCGTLQKYCLDCKKYQCYCIKEFKQCHVSECSRLLCCVDGIPICICCNGRKARYLLVDHNAHWSWTQSLRQQHLQGVCQRAS